MALRWLVETWLIVLLGHQDKDMKNKPKDHQEPAAVERDFRMPLHYPRYRKEEYEKMEEWRLDLLLEQYGLSFKGNLHEKRAYAIGTFLWPDQY